MRSSMRDLFTILWQVNSQPNHLEIGLEINPRAQLFEIHFPEMPIVPGACLIGLVLDRLENWQGRTLQINAMARVNFGFPVTPGMRLSLELRLVSPVRDEWSLFFRYNATGGQSMQGTLKFVQCAEEAA